MISAAILSLVLGGLMAGFSGGSKAARLGMATLDIVSTAGMASQHLKKDLRALVGPVPLPEFLSAHDSRIRFLRFDGLDSKGNVKLSPVEYRIRKVKGSDRTVLTRNADGRAVPFVFDRGVVFMMGTDPRTPPGTRGIEISFGFPPTKNHPSAREPIRLNLVAMGIESAALQKAVRDLGVSPDPRSPEPLPAEAARFPFLAPEIEGIESLADLFPAESLLLPNLELDGKLAPALGSERTGPGPGAGGGTSGGPSRDATGLTGSDAGSPGSEGGPPGALLAEAAALASREAKNRRIARARTVQLEAVARAIGNRSVTDEVRSIATRLESSPTTGEPPDPQTVSQALESLTALSENLGIPVDDPADLAPPDEGDVIFLAIGGPATEVGNQVDLKVPFEDDGSVIIDAGGSERGSSRSEVGRDPAARPDGSPAVAASGPGASDQAGPSGPSGPSAPTGTSPGSTENVDPSDPLSDDSPSDDSPSDDPAPTDAVEAGAPDPSEPQPSRGSYY